MNSHLATWMRAAVAAIAVGALATSAAAAPESGSYIGGSIGLHMPTRSTVLIQDRSTNPFRSNNHLEFAKGYMLNAAGGYKWDTGFRSELEVSYRHAGIDTVSWETSGVETVWGGSQRSWSAMANLLFDVADMGMFGVYLGGGAGFGWHKWGRVRGNNPPAFMDRTFSDTDSAFQWQAIVGATMAVSSTTDVFIDYRYIGSNNLSFESDPPGAPLSEYNARSHNILIGARFFFGP